MSPAAARPPTRRPPHSPGAAPRDRGRYPYLGCAGDGSDRGSLMLYMLPISVVLLLFAGLVIDGGTHLAARGRAADLASQAARAGANAQDLHTGRSPRIDPVAAQAAAQRLLTAAGATGTLTVHGLNTVSVSVRVPAHTMILAAIGFRDASGSATATATALLGVTTVARGDP